MNISTGGPHILLFERDQQLAALLMSELQLAGYEGHTARTAVEVFDAIARYPVRLVLVNLAQAAAARREFWVALDTQRRGSSIQVLNFRCTNLAGYGARDLEEHPAIIADIDIDGMLGLMKLLDVIRARVPNVDLNANTVPRMSRANPSASAMTPRYTQPIPVPNGLSNNSRLGSGSTSRNTLPDEGNSQLSGSRASAASVPHTPTSVTPVPPLQSTGSFPVFQAQHTSQMSASSSGGENSQAAYPDKIRAVIYPNQQRNWNAPTGTSQEVSQLQDSAVSVPFTSQAAPAGSTTEIPVLQRLAGGQVNGGASGESGLAQLTRMIQESQDSGHVLPVQAIHPNDAYVLPTHTPPTVRVSSASEAISSQSLRPAPIQDLSEERLMTTSPLNTDGRRRPDVLSRANYHPQSSVQVPPSAAQSPLASIATSGMVAHSPSASARRETVEGTDRPVTPKDAQRGKEDLATLVQTALQAKIGERYVEKEVEAQPVQGFTDNTSSEHEWERQEEQQQDEVLRQEEQVQGEIKRQEKRQQGEVQSDGDEIVAENSVILDILQSLPPIPAIGQQAVQPQVLNGRITRSLGRVLLDGHLVPQDRLEVAQNIQRMLRGVDLNYQLGEILLMFKLLTPDQLLAASLVSYGLITTTQISAFGRIRQELYSIGLEYDLENLLVLFRVLTPEQLREARSNIQN